MEIPDEASSVVKGLAGNRGQNLTAAQETNFKKISQKHSPPL